MQPCRTVAQHAALSRSLRGCAACLIGQAGAASLAAASRRGDTGATPQGRVVGPERTNTVEREASVARRAGGMELARSASRLGDQLSVRARVLLSLQQRAGNRAVRGLVQRLR